MQRAHANRTSSRGLAVSTSGAVQDAHDDDDDDGSGDGMSMHSEDVLIGTDASKQHDVGDASHDSAALAAGVWV